MLDLSAGWRRSMRSEPFARDHKARKRLRAAFAARTSRRRADRRNMHELHQRPAAAHAPQGAPIGVIAKIAPASRDKRAGSAVARLALRRRGKGAFPRLTRFDPAR